MRVPKDQGLTLTIFMSIGIFAVLLFWIFLPMTVDLHGDDHDRVKVLKPEEAVLQAEAILMQAEKSLAEIEKKREEEGKGGADKEGKAK